MADLSITASDVKLVKKFDDLPPLPNTDSLNEGQYGRVDASSGKATGGNGTSAGEVGFGGVVYNKQGDGLVSLTRNAILDVGEALASLNFGAKIYLSDTDKTLADAAGTVSQVIGYVIPGFGATTADKLLKVEVQDG
jgi:hypothetical protein